MLVMRLGGQGRGGGGELDFELTGEEKGAAAKFLRLDGVGENWR